MGIIESYSPWFGKTDVTEEPRTYRIYKWVLQQATQYRHKPTLFNKISETDWDLLIILDACRYDTLVDVADSVVVEPAISPVTVTQRFVEEVNRQDLLEGTTYVSANPTTRDLDTENINHVPAYDFGWDDSLSTVKPQEVYSAVGDLVRSGESVVAHTLQPHYPHICKLGSEVVPVPGGLHPRSLGARQEETPIQNIPYAFFRGICNSNTAHQSYKACTRYAWEEAKDQAVRLAEEGYTVAITADHGELLGEWEMAGHPWNVRLRPLVEVPWVVIDRPSQHSGLDSSVSDKLESLGYI